jgi:hypothetical protein
MRRPCSPPAIFCSPRPRVAPLLLTALALCCWHPTRAPRSPSAANTARRSTCRRRICHWLALSLPLFCSVAPATPSQSISPANLLAKPLSSARSSPFLLPCVTGAARFSHRHTPQPLHLAQILPTQSLHTSSPCSLSRSRPTPALPLAGFAPPRAAPPLAPPGSAPPSTARLATPPTNSCKGIAPPCPSGAHARARPPCSSVVRRERRCAAAAAAPSRRRPDFSSVRWTPSCPLCLPLSPGHA